MGLDEYANKHLFKPLNIKSVDWQYSPTGLTQGGGGVSIRAEDLLKIGQLMLNNGKWQDKQLLPKGWVEQSFTAYSLSMPEMDAEYGLTWWIFKFPYKGEIINAYAAAGNGGNYLFVVPDLNLTSVIMSSAYNTPYMHKQAHAILGKAVLPSL